MKVLAGNLCRANVAAMGSPMRLWGGRRHAYESVANGRVQFDAVGGMSVCMKTHEHLQAALAVGQHILSSQLITCLPCCSQCMGMPVMSNDLIRLLL